jgi:hypothetical protein
MLVWACIEAEVQHCVVHVANAADAEDLKSSGRERPCGFDSHRRYSSWGDYQKTTSSIDHRLGFACALGAQ